jgi:hypothetical protein
MYAHNIYIHIYTVVLQMFPRLARGRPRMRIRSRTMEPRTTRSRIAESHAAEAPAAEPQAIEGESLAPLVELTVAQALLNKMTEILQ